LDRLLGGGLLPGTLTVVLGATGIGKTQLGLQFAHAGKAQDGRAGIVFDMACRGDPQNHAEYARRMMGWELQPAPPHDPANFGGFFDRGEQHGCYLQVFDWHGRRVTRRDLDEDAWRAWQSELAVKLGATIRFFYGNFVQGARRAVIDGVEPTDTPGESIQHQLVDYVYHQIVRKDPDWVARDLFRQAFRAHAAAVTAHTYDPAQIACLVLCTSHEVLLDELIARPLGEGGLLAIANTVLLMGKVRDGLKLGRGLYVAKHRGSACSDQIALYEIDDHGLHVR
jgi:KaiC/GvpD/RAD55 family RecA-like ATPase